MDQSTTHDQAARMERLLYEVKKVIVGQDHFLERVLVADLEFDWAHAAAG